MSQTPLQGAITAAYRSVTDACNACHKSANVGVIAIKVPDASAFPDQDFRAPKP